MEFKDYIALGAATIALGAAVVGNYVALRSQRRQYFADMRKWADEACNKLSEAVHACDLAPAKMDGGFFQLRHELRIALSALVDRGRWFFPNLEHRSFGIEKEEAYKGIRPFALDQLVYAYRQVGQMSHTSQQPNIALRDGLVEIQRKFTSEIQIYLDPRNRRSMFTRLTTFKGEQTAVGRGA